MHIVYFSPTGGTRKAAEIIANAIAPTTAEIDITDHKQQEEPIELTPDDSILVAVPVYGGRVPAVAINRLKRITGHNTPAIPVVVYGNRDYDDALLELKSALEANGFKTVACMACIAEHSIMRVYAHGRPDAADTARLQEFGRQIKAKLSKLKPGEIPVAPTVKGNPDYKIYNGVPLKPYVTKKCNLCGKCAALCPVEAILVDNPKTTDKERCISCMRCMAVCPQKARKVSPIKVHLSTQMLKKACETRKEPELFI